MIETKENLTAGIGEFVVSGNDKEVLKTYALGSCVAVIIRDPILKTTGLLHIALPDSKLSIEKSLELPSYFADLGIPLMLRAMARKGLRSKGAMLRVKITGGSNVNDKNGVFNIGKRNILAVKKILWQLGMGAIAEDVGGTHSRTVTVEVATGKVLITSGRSSVLEL